MISVYKYTQSFKNRVSYSFDFFLLMAPMTQLLRAQNLSKHYQGEAVLSTVSFDIHQGEFISLLGPSGCGKTTLLKLISGFDTPDSGDIYYQDERINELAPQMRNIHTVFQHYALFPHMNVFNNAAFPLRAKGCDEEEVYQQVTHTLNQVKLGHLGHKYPHELSGGQQQRVAIARAIVNKPKLILLDESLSALDESLRREMQIELKQLQRELGITFIYVTHSQEEALSMSERVIVLNNGHIQQIGTPREVYESPSNLYVATFIGDADVFDLTIKETKDDLLCVDIEEKTLWFENTIDAKQDDKIHFVVRSEDYRVWAPNEVDDASEMLAGVITEVIYKGSTVDLLVKLQSGKIISATEFFNEDDENLNYTLNERVWVHWLNGWEVILPYEN